MCNDQAFYVTETRKKLALALVGKTIAEVLETSESLCLDDIEDREALFIKLMRELEDKLGKVL